MKWFRRITPAEMAAKDLAIAELRLLEALAAKEFAQAVVDENEMRIKRLRKYLAELEKKGE